MPIAVCDKCPKFATHMVRDVIRHEDPFVNEVRLTPLGIRRGCNDHPVKSREYLTQLPAPKDQA